MSRALAPESRSGYCIFLNTAGEGRVPAGHDENLMPMVYATREEAQREMAGNMMEKLQQFLDGLREFEDAMFVEDFILPVEVLPDGSVLDLEGNWFGKKTW